MLGICVITNYELRITNDGLQAAYQQFLIPAGLVLCEEELEAAYGDSVAGGEDYRLYGLVVDKSAVGRSLVAQEVVAVPEGNLCVVARHTRVVNHQVVVEASSYRY